MATSIVCQDGTAIDEAHRNQSGLATGGSAQVEDSITGTRIERNDRKQRRFLLDVNQPGAKLPPEAGTSAGSNSPRSSKPGGRLDGPVLVTKQIIQLIDRDSGCICGNAGRLRSF